MRYSSHTYAFRRAHTPFAPVARSVCTPYRSLCGAQRAPMLLRKAASVSRSAHGTRFAKPAASATPSPTTHPQQPAVAHSAVWQPPAGDVPAKPKRSRLALATCVLLLIAFLALTGLGLAAVAQANAQAQSASKASYQEEATPALAEETYTTVTFSAVGDNLMNFPVVQAADWNAGTYGDGWYDFTPMYSGVYDIVSTHDLNFIDIETILGGDHLGISGYPTFNSPAAIAEQVAAYGWNLATTATNHSLDMGITGINNSSATWAQYPQVTVTGTFTSWEDRATIRTVEREGITFAFLAYTDYMNGLTLPAGYEYAVAVADTQAMIDDVSRAHELADVVIVAMSWGSENAFYPNDTQRYYAQVLANLGVDLVVGFGPHVIQPIEWYYGHDDAGNPTGSQTLVVFSLGNFLSNQPYAYANVQGCFTCAFERFGSDGEISLTNLRWTPLINHIDGGYHEVFKLRDYTYDLAWAHDNLSAYGDPIEYAYGLTAEIIGPSGIAIAW